MILVFIYSACALHVSAYIKTAIFRAVVMYA
jgi:hypothetical protein